jgi:hypothetical protein
MVPSFNCSASEKDRVDDSPALANLLGQSIHFMALANAEFANLDTLRKSGTRTISLRTYAH